MKKKKIVLSLVAALSLAFGTGIVLSQADKVQEVDATSGGTVTYTVSSTNTVTTSGTAPDGSSVTYSSTYSTKYQLTGGNSMTLTISGVSGITFSSLTMSMKSNSSSGAGGLKYSVDGGTTYTDIVATQTKFNNANWNGEWSSSYKDVTKSISINGTSSDLVINLYATANSLYCQSFALTWAPTAPATTALAVTPDGETIFEGQSKQYGVTVTPTDASSDVAWSIGASSTGTATIDSAGLLSATAAGDIVVVATATDGTGITGQASLTVVADPILTFTKTGSVVDQFAGGPFVADGLVFTATYTGKGTVTVPAESITFTAYEGDTSVGTTITNATTKVVAAYEGKTLEMPVTIAATSLYSFGSHADFAKWGNSYGSHELSYTELTASFTGTSRQTTTITDSPVSKAATVTITLAKNNGLAVFALKMEFEQWSTRTQTAELYLGSETDKTATASLFDVSSLEYVVPSSKIVTAFQMKTTESNQVGWKTLTMSYLTVDAAYLSDYLLADNAEGQCVSKFADAKNMYMNILTAAEQTSFKESATYANARARYEAWALNQGEEPYAAGSSSALDLLTGEGSNGALAAIVVSLGVIALGAGAYFFLRKKKRA